MQRMFMLIALCALVPSASIGQTKLPALSKVHPLEFCVCGNNTRTQCDGTYLHYISDCYDENNNYCGYDDQVTGEMCFGQRRMKRLKPKYPLTRK